MGQTRMDGVSPKVVEGLPGSNGSLRHTLVPVYPSSNRFLSTRTWKRFNGQVILGINSPFVGRLSGEKAEVSTVVHGGTLECADTPEEVEGWRERNYHLWFLCPGTSDKVKNEKPNGMSDLGRGNDDKWRKGMTKEKWWRPWMMASMWIMVH